jgi:hypothetical protein
LGITGPGRRVTRRRPDESASAHPGLCASTPAASFSDEAVQVVQGGIALGIDDLVHVLGTADHA